ncbi:hypothetical protein A9Q75_05155 [Colwellia psychrerythraea]|uniref:Uncharacterized protein n=1 Tax=Colwellia psychrerythraea TaxID=28229 RepID=A0A1Y5EJF8_COLPS|nr:hypothetical protein A9Q75_05155 [Colwellia psychrerythraea]
MWNDSLYVVVKDRLSEEVIDYIAHKPFDVLSLSHGKWHDVSRLIKYKDKITELNIRGDDIDWQSISELSYIERLFIDIGAGSKCDLALNKLTHLKHLNSDWCKGFEHNLKNLDNLKSVVIRGYKKEDFNSFEKMVSLEFLELVGTRTLSSLDAINNFKKLRYLEIGNCGKLANVSAAIDLPKLESLWLDKCKVDNDYSVLSNLSSINEIFIGGAMQDLRWLKNLKTLTRLRLDCKLEDGELDFLYDMPNLKFVLFNNKRNFSVKIKDIQKHLEAKGHNQAELRMTGLTFDEAFK